jgi:hypothetical protein
VSVVVEVIEPHVEITVRTELQLADEAPLSVVQGSFDMTDLPPEVQVLVVDANAKAQHALGVGMNAFTELGAELLRIKNALGTQAFKTYVHQMMPFSMTQAYVYMRVASRFSPEQVAQLNYSFDALGMICDLPSSVLSEVLAQTGRLTQVAAAKIRRDAIERGFEPLFKLELEPEKTKQTRDPAILNETLAAALRTAGDLPKLTLSKVMGELTFETLLQVFLAAEAFGSLDVTALPKGMIELGLFAEDGTLTKKGLKALESLKQFAEWCDAPY